MALDDCIPTALGKTGDGYGQFRVKGVAFLAHRLAYMLAYGPIPDGLVVRHACDNPACVNPSHLELGTHGDNAKDRATRGRGARGERHGNAKLTAQQVRDIRDKRAAGVKLKPLAQEYGVHISLISQIANGKMWKEA